MTGLECCSAAATEGLAAYALEADPGKLTVSHPLFCSPECAERVAHAPAMHREGLPPVRILVVVSGQAVAYNAQGALDFGEAA